MAQPGPGNPFVNMRHAELDRTTRAPRSLGRVLLKNGWKPESRKDAELLGVATGDASKVEVARPQRRPRTSASTTTQSDDSKKEK